LKTEWGAGGSAGKRVEPTIADLPAGTFEAISESDAAGNFSLELELCFGTASVDGRGRLNAGRFCEFASLVLFGTVEMEFEAGPGMLGFATLVTADGGEATVELDSGAGPAGLEMDCGVAGRKSGIGDRCGRADDAIDDRKGLGVLKSPKTLWVDAQTVPRHITASAAPQK
jgi:hypothetical protein